ncbi:hypothetical protein V6N13_046970 [Hibiscus sabdariffa]
MRILSWNIRGLCSAMKKRYLRNVQRKNSVDMVLIQEAKMEKICSLLVAQIWVSDNFDFVFLPSVGASGGILVIWQCSIFSMDTVEVDRNFIIIQGKWVKEDITCYILTVYAPCDGRDQERLWGSIVHQVNLFQVRGE